MRPVNKVDLVDAESARDVEKCVREINATADIITSQYARIDLADVLGIGAFDMARTMAGDPRWLDEDTHHHDPQLASVGIELDGTVDHRALESWLTAHLVERGDDVYRIKGLFAVDNDTRRFVLQGVHRMFDIRPSTPWGREDPVGKVVFIGRDLDRAELASGLQSCVTR